MFQVSRLLGRPLTRALSAKAEGAPQSGFWFGKIMFIIEYIYVFKYFEC